MGHGAVDRPRARWVGNRHSGWTWNRIFRRHVHCYAYGASAQRMMDNQKVAKATKAPAQALSTSRAKPCNGRSFRQGAGLDKKVGSPKPGKQADIIMLNGKDLNLFRSTIPSKASFPCSWRQRRYRHDCGQITKQNGKLKYRGLEKKWISASLVGKSKGVKLAA